MTAALTWDDLLRYHREFFLPDFERILDAHLNRIDLRFGEMHTHFERIYARMDRFESEVRAFRISLELKCDLADLMSDAATLRARVVRMERLEEWMTGVETNLEHMALRSDVADLEAQIVRLRERIVRLEGESPLADRESERAEIEDLKGQAATLRERIEELERKLS